MVNKYKIAIIGAGGFGQEVFHLLDKDMYDCIGFIDYNKKENSSAPIIGHENDMTKLVKEFGFSKCVLSIGDMKQREKIYNQIKNYALEFPRIIDSSVKYFSNDLAKGVIIYPGVVIMNDCKIGKFTFLNSSVTLGHDVVIGDFCNLNPGAHLAGRITIGNGSLVGIGASIKENVTIGDNVVIGAGSVVVKNIPDNTVVYGVPAKEVYQ
tara:strand:+ start:4232 stop:4858 length:627 start_codon:yes stop_codon:yes gene_type:complete